MLDKYAYKDEVPAFGVPTMNRFGHLSMLLLQKIGIYIIVNIQYTKNLNKGYKSINCG